MTELVATSVSTEEHEPPPKLSDGLFSWERLVEDTLELLSVLRQTIYYVFRGKKEPGAFMREAYAIGNQSLVFVTATNIVISMIMVIQAAMQAMKVVPDLTMLGPNMIQMMLREFAPTICAMMLATRVGAGIAAELGSMVVTEQVDALRMCAADPIEYLVVPRFTASLVMTVVLTFWCATVALLSGAVTANVHYDVGYLTFFDFSLVGYGDLIVCGMKALAYGAAIPIVSSHRGLTTFGGSEGVGWATTSAVVHSSLTVIFLDLLISIFGYFVFPP